MAESNVRKFKIGPVKDKDELLKRVPYKRGTAEGKGTAEESQPSPKEGANKTPPPPPKEQPKIAKPPTPKTPPTPLEPADPERKSDPASNGVKEESKEIKKLHQDWTTHMDTPTESAEVKSEKKKSGNLKTYLLAGSLLLILSVGGATAGYFYSNPERFKQFFAGFKTSGGSSEEATDGFITPVPVSSGGEVAMEPEGSKIGYTQEGDVHFETEKVLDVEGRWFGPQSKIHSFPGGKRVAYLALAKAEAEDLTNAVGGRGGPVIGFLNILNLGNGKVKSFNDESVYLGSGIAISPDGKKVAYVSDPFGLRQVDIDTSEIEDLDESLEFKVVGGNLAYSEDGKYLYYSLAVGGGEDENYTLEVWRINLETKSREPILEVEKTTEPSPMGAPAGVDFAVSGSLLAFVRGGDLVVYDLQADSEKFKTVGAIGYLDVNFVDSQVVVTVGTAEDLNASIFNPNTGKEITLKDDQVSEIIKVIGLSEEDIITRRVISITPVGDQELVLESEMFLAGEEGAIYYLVKSDIEFSNFSLVSKDARSPFPVSE